MLKNDKFQLGVNYLKKNDKILSEIIDKNLEFIFSPDQDLYKSLVRIIISQQLSNKASNTIISRFINLLGAITPTNFLKAEKTQVFACGISKSKYQFIYELSLAIRDQGFNLNKLRELNENEIKTELTQLKGVGEWSANIFMIFALGKLDVFPKKDIGLKNAISRFYDIESNDYEKKLDELTSRWSPYRSIACLYLWKAYDQK